MLRVYVVDDHDIVREGVRAALPYNSPIEIVGESATATGLLEDLLRVRPDIVLTDYRLPDMTGDELCRRALAALPGLEVIIFTTYLNEEVVQRATDAGAASFVTKAAGLDALREAVAEVAAGRRALGPGTTSMTVKRLHDSAAEHTGVAHSVTPHQEQVLELLAQGCTHGQIASRLNISESTVRFHIQRLKARLGVNSKAELIATAITRALIAPSQDAPRS